MFGLKYIISSALKKAQPMKKKKKLDPMMTKIRVEKKRRRLWKDCKKLMKMEKQLKPLDEIEIPYHIIDNKQKYLREKIAFSVETLEDRADLLREWSVYRNKMHCRDLQTIDKVEYSQHRALEMLLKISPTLYHEATKIDESFLPFNARGTTATPPINQYDSPDGEYIDVSRKWEAPILPDDKMKGKVNSRKNRIRAAKMVSEVKGDEVK